MILAVLVIGGCLFLLADTAMRTWRAPTRWTPSDAESYHAPADFDWH